MYCGLGVIGGYSLSPGVVYRGVHWRFCWLIYCIFYLATKSQNGVLVYGSSLYNDGLDFLVPQSTRCCDEARLRLCCKFNYNTFLTFVPGFALLYILWPSHFENRNLVILVMLMMLDTTLMDETSMEVASLWRLPEGLVVFCLYITGPSTGSM